MKSESFLRRPRSLCCVFCRNTSLNVSVELDPYELIFVSSLLRIVIWRQASPRGHSGATSFTGSTFFPLRYPLSGSEEKTFPCWSSTLSIVTQGKQGRVFRR